MRIKVVSPDEMAARTARFRATEPRVLREVFELRELAESGTAVFCWWSGGRFTWCCPGCGNLNGGTLGDEPVSGWDAPRWVNGGTPEQPTLTPSLGCPQWRRGSCTGHYWLREGILVQA